MSVGVTGENFVDLVTGAPSAGAAVTVLFGSRNDNGEDLAVVRANAVETVALVQQRAPGTALVVVGRAWDGADVPGSVLALRDVVRDVAAAAGARFVDPLAEGWFAGRPELIAPDGVSPTDAGHSYLADQLTPVIQEILAARRD